MDKDLTIKAISAYNGNLHNGMTRALDAVVALVLEEAAAFTSAQAQAFRDDAHDRKQFGDSMMHKRGLAVAAYFDQHAAAIRALAEKPVSAEAKPS